MYVFLQEIPSNRANRRRAGVCFCGAIDPGGNVQFPQPAFSRDQIAEQIQDCGLKPTEQRVRIAEILMRNPTHMTADHILAEVRASGEPISKATVYNTLKVLAEHGLIRQIHLDPERSVYDSTRVAHHHFHDLDTGELRDINPNEIEFSRFPALPEGMEADGVEVVIRLRKKRTGEG
jgi:Fur family transcriptional regulator, iron response regulator